jgi:hypothetical protein
MTITDHRLQKRLGFCVTACVPALLVLAGCGGGSDPSRFELAGTVSYDGKPVPAGFIIFKPDAAAGNSGPGAQVDIRDGKYHTMPGQGTVGGPHIASIFGFDGKPFQTAKGPHGQPLTNPVGKPLFKTAAIKANLPKQTAVYDFVVPKQ